MIQQVRSLHNHIHPYSPIAHDEQRLLEAEIERIVACSPVAIAWSVEGHGIVVVQGLAVQLVQKVRGPDREWQPAAQGQDGRKSYIGKDTGKRLPLPSFERR